jgi:hypothetical protein
MPYYFILSVFYVPCQGLAASVLLVFIGGTNLTPLSPLQPDTLNGIERYLWLERGVQERGGFTPSQILSPSQAVVKLITLLKICLRGG